MTFDLWVSVLEAWPTIGLEKAQEVDRCWCGQQQIVGSTPSSERPNVQPLALAPTVHCSSIHNTAWSLVSCVIWVCHYLFMDRGWSCASLWFFVGAFGFRSACPEACAMFTLWDPAPCRAVCCCPVCAEIFQILTLALVFLSFSLQPVCLAAPICRMRTALSALRVLSCCSWLRVVDQSPPLWDEVTSGLMLTSQLSYTVFVHLSGITTPHLWACASILRCLYLALRGLLQVVVPNLTLSLSPSLSLHPSHHLAVPPVIHRTIIEGDYLWFNLNTKQ